MVIRIFCSNFFCFNSFCRNSWSSSLVAFLKLSLLCLYGESLPILFLNAWLFSFKRLRLLFIDCTMAAMAPPPDIGCCYLIKDWMSLITQSSNLLFFDDYYFFNFISLTNIINHFQSLVNFSEARVLSVKMSRIFAAVTNKKLRTSGVSACMCHW